MQVLARQHIPRSLLSPELRGVPSPSWDVGVADGQISAIRPNAQAATHLLMPCPVDVHVHLDKTGVVQRTGAAQGDLHRAIELMAAERDAFTAEDVRARMQAALAQAHACGSRALRTHLDWPTRTAPVALAVWEELRTAWRGRLVLQAVSLTPLDFFSDAADSEDLGLQVATANSGLDHAAGECLLLGAFVWRNAQLCDKLQRVFDLALKHGLGLDFHVDEGLDEQARGLRAIAELTLKNRMQGRVTCGHACSLSMQPPEEAAATLALCAQAGIHLVALPTTNAYLQGSWQHTPMERGVTRLQEARAAGVNVAMATDNVADAFFPYGSYDLLDTFGFGVQLAHLSPADDWLHSIACAPALAMGLPWSGLLGVGAPADLVQLSARNLFELISPAGRMRRVMRAGHWINP